MSYGLLAFEPTVALEALDATLQEQVIQQLGVCLQDQVPTEYLIGRTGELAFGLIMPETPGNEAQETVRQLINAVRLSSFGAKAEGIEVHFVGHGSVVEKNYGTAMDQETMLERVSHNLERAQDMGPNKVFLETPRDTSPFVEEDIRSLLDAQP